VRCAACKNSWHQDPEGSVPEPDAGPVATEPAEAPPPFPPAEDGAAPESMEADRESRTDIEPDPGQAVAESDESAPTASAAEVRDAGTDEETWQPTEEYDAAPPPPQTWQPPESDYQDDFSPFAADEEPERRRRWPALLVGLLLIAAAAAAFWFLAPPEWKQRLGIVAGGETPLQLMMTHSDRQKLASGNELLAVSGRVINPTDERQNVPPIQAQLRSRSGQLVHSWTIAPPARSLPPRASATFNSAEVNVPSGGDELTITLGNPRA
jgi:hypothetical protein